jgi:3-hydroxyisobutyrate dehydrogenase-like beta-hydroxyacid dehydrogenase
MPGKVGFIGLGAMGGATALNLSKHGFSRRA